MVAGLLFGCLGDLFLLRPLQKHFFALGTASFFLGHVCYLVHIYTTYAVHVRWFWIVLVCAAYAAGIVVVYKGSRRSIPRALRPLALAYMVMLCTLSISVFLPLVTAFTWGKLAAFLGASFFLASDGVLCDALHQEGRADQAELRRHGHVHPCAGAADHGLCILSRRKSSKKRGAPVVSVPFFVQSWKII